MCYCRPGDDRATYCPCCAPFRDESMSKEFDQSKTPPGYKGDDFMKIKIDNSSAVTRRKLRELSNALAEISKKLDRLASLVTGKRGSHSRDKHRPGQGDFR